MNVKLSKDERYSRNKCKNNKTKKTQNIKLKNHTATATIIQR